MYSCPVCKRQFGNFVFLRTHIRDHETLGTFNSPFLCGQDNCYKSFSIKQSWRQHVRIIHGYLEDHYVAHQNMKTEKLPNMDVDDFVCDHDDNSTEAQEDSEEIKTELANLVKEEAQSLIAELKANSSVTTSTVNMVARSCDSIIEGTIEYAKECVSRFLKRKAIDIDASELFEEISTASKPFNDLRNDYQQKKFFSSQPGFVEPVEITLGYDYEVRHTKGGPPMQKKIYRSWQYVPIMETIKSVLSEPKIFDQIRSMRKRNDGVIEEFYDGSVCANHPLFSDQNRLSLILELYYDDIETANPIGSKPVIHKLGVFYFIIKNLPSSFNSNSANIHLLGLAYTGDLKKYGYNKVLEKFSEDILVLETSGIDVAVNGIVYKIYASIGSVNGDNLGRHTIFGFFESFNAKKFCETCMASRDDIQNLFTESDFEMRTKENYEAQLAEVTRNQRYSKECGLKDSCALHETLYWHVTSNKTGDLMHDFLEGVGPFELKLILWQLSVNENRFSFKKLNRRISSFPYGLTDIKSKPSEINNLDCAIDHSLKQKAFQFWCLFRLLPLMIGDLVPPDSVYWKFYLELRELADCLFCQKWTIGMASYFRELYATHMEKFKNLFPNFNLIPKHHFLLHYPTFAMCTGPPYKTMVAGQEMKGNFFKRSAHIICCFKNIPYSLAWKHQYFFHLCCQTSKRFRNVIEVISTIAIRAHQAPCAPAVLLALGKEAEDEIQLATKLILGGQEYRDGQILILDKDDQNMCVFGKIHSMVSTDYKSPENLFFIVAKYKTLSFESHQWAYLVRLSKEFQLIRFTSLLDYHPVDIYAGPAANEFFIPVRYYSFKTE